MEPVIKPLGFDWRTGTAMTDADPGRHPGDESLNDFPHMSAWAIDTPPSCIRIAITCRSSRRGESGIMRAAAS